MIQVKMKNNDYQYKLTENVHHSIRIHIEINKKFPLLNSDISFVSSVSLLVSNNTKFDARILFWLTNMRTLDGQLFKCYCRNT